MEDNVPREEQDLYPHVCMFVFGVYAVAFKPLLKLKAYLKDLTFYLCFI